MEFKDRIATHPNRKKITLIDELSSTEKVVDIEDILSNVTEPGTPITAEVLQAQHDKIEQLQGDVLALQAQGGGSSGSTGSAFPVGSIFMSATLSTPQEVTTAVGGVWQAWGGGRVPLGVGSNGQTNYLAPSQTGGSENSVAAHTHGQASHTHTEHNANWTQSQEGNSTGLRGIVNPNSTLSGVFLRGAARTGGTSGTTSSGTGHDLVLNATHNSVTPAINSFGDVGGNRMPYITCYMYVRIS